jgi:hypothetical protein
MLTPQFNGQYPASAIGGVTTSPSIAGTASIAAWPPTSLNPGITQAAQIALLPTLTQTGTPITMPTQSHPPSVSVGNGWAFPRDTQRAWVTVAGCGYPK